MKDQPVAAWAFACRSSFAMALGALGSQPIPIFRRLRMASALHVISRHLRVTRADHATNIEIHSDSTAGTQGA